MTEYISRYELAMSNGTQTTLPFIKLDKKNTDKTFVWVENISRMDIISDKYYGKPIYGIIIMMANPEYGSLEYDIPNNTIIRIPYPLEDTLKEYYDKYQNIKRTN